MEWEKGYYVLILFMSLALIFPILYTDVLNYDSNITLGGFIAYFPWVFIVIMSVFLILYGWNKAHG
jgi:hypothetical protein